MHGKSKNNKYPVTEATGVTARAREKWVGWPDDEFKLFNGCARKSQWKHDLEGLVDSLPLSLTG